MTTMDTPTINNFPPADSHFTAEDRKAIYLMGFNHTQLAKDIVEIKSDVREIKDGISARVTVLELARVSAEAGIKAVDVKSDDRFTANARNIDDHELRLRAVETFQETLAGKMWGIGIIASAILTIVGVAISHYWH